MRETERRIRQYRAKLPRIRERIVASFLLFALSIAMMTMSAFAWTTLSVSPEVSGVTTSIAANGNLEIALSNKEGTAPDPSAIGDGNGNLTLRNLTWGNLLNLSDPAYGLDHLSLRPATLSKNNLLTNPLYSAVYGSDGRMEDLDNDYAYTTWNSLQNAFMLPTGNAYGVRAISSITYNGDKSSAYSPIRNHAGTQLIMVQKDYTKLTKYPGTEYYDGKKNPYMTAIADLIALYVSAQIDEVLNNKTGGESADIVFNGDRTKTKALDDMYEMMSILYQDYLDIGELFVDAVYMYQTKQAIQAGQTTTPTKYTVAELCDMSKTATGKTTLTQLGMDSTSYKNLQDYANDISRFDTALKKMESYCQKAKTEAASEEDQITWSKHIEAIVNEMMVINKTYINGKPFNTVVSQLMSAVKGNILGALGNLQGIVDDVIGKNPTVESREGLVKDFEVYSGANMEVLELPITVKAMGMTIAINGNFCTNAPKGVSLCNNEVEEAYAAVTQGSSEDRGEGTAGDTFGLAVDFWIRSNAPQTYLTLEGELIKTQQKATAEVGGKTVDVLIATVPINNPSQPTDETGAGDDVAGTGGTEGGDGGTTEAPVPTIQVEVYRDEDGKLYILESGEELPEEPVGIYNKMIDVTIGYEGSNRIWSSEKPGVTGGLPLYSTSQGSGSCYTFYSDPVEAVKILEMLAAMKIAFIDQNGVLLATASLDTNDYFEDGGQYTLPIILDANSLIVTTASGQTRAITRLDKNEEVRITALVYLDGDLVENDNVLSSSDIEGQFNIQFGSTYALVSIGDEELYEQTRIISAGFVNGQAPTFDYKLGTDGEPVEHAVNVFVKVDGDAPEMMSASFIRQITATQGARQDEFELKYNPNTDRWEGTAYFAMPGDYVLRTARLDGLDYKLKLDDPDAIKVKVNGFGVQSVTLNMHGQTIMTADSFVTSDLEVKLATSTVYPKTVKAIFVGDNKEQIIVPLSGAAGTYTGSARFIKSDKYTLEFLELDGVLMNLSDSQKQKITVFTGLSAEVYIYDSTPAQFKLDEGTTRNVKMAMVIEDNAGNEIKSLNNVKLYYKVAGSALGANGLDANMTWNEDADLYEGTFKFTTTGTYSFRQVTVDISGITNTIQAASDAVTLIAYNTDTFGYTANETYETQFAPDGNAHFALTLASARTARAVYAKLALVETAEDGSRNVIENYAVQGTLQEDNYIFKIPKHNGTQDGEWVVVAVKATGVYSNGVYYGNGAEIGTDGLGTGADFDTATGYVELIEGEDFDYDSIKTTISSKMLYTFAPTLTGTILGAADNNGDGIITEEEKIGTFMQSYPIGTVSVGLTDIAGNPLEDATVTVQYTYDRANMSSYGSYTTSSAVIPDVETLTLAYDGNNGVYSATSGKSLQLAGAYTVSLEVKIGDTTFTPASTNLTGDALPTHKVYSKKPTVKVTGVTPTTTSVNRHYNNTTPTSVTQLVTGSFFSKDDYNAVVYLYFKYATDYGDYDQEAFDALIPQVELTLSEMPSDFTSASATFGAVEYGFTPGALKLSKEIGSATDGEFSYTILVDHKYPKLYPAGTHSADKITVVYDSVTYTVNLSNQVTISQPDAPVYLNYSIFGYDFNGDIPDMEISHNGGAIEVTLPTVNNWVSRQEEYSYGDATPVVTESTVSYLTDTKKGIILTTYYYDLYTRTKTSVTADTTTTIFDGTYTVTGWQIGDTVYAPGTKVKISKGQTAIAVIEEIESERKVISSNTATQTTVTLRDVYSSNTSGYSKRSDATTTLYTSDKYPNGYTYVE